jgi:hypothetical protein
LQTRPCQVAEHGGVHWVTIAARDGRGKPLVIEPVFGGAAAAKEWADRKVAKYVAQ